MQYFHVLQFLTRIRASYKLHLFSNDRNLVSRDKGQRSTFSDDCGIWDSSKGSSPRTYFMTLRDGKLKTVYKKGDKFCDTKKVKGKKTFTPIESQPENVKYCVDLYLY
jgi:hypothetical protein